MSASGSQSSSVRDPAGVKRAKELLEAFRAQRNQIVEGYFDFLRIPSVSSEPQYKADVLKAADWVQDFAGRIGFKTERWETTGYPVVFAEWSGAGPSAPTVLIYNHYDVQPVDPLALWESPPFEPVLKGEEVFARGAQDNKGQCFSVLAGLRYLLETHGKLPVNVKLIIEGEEETGSGGLGGIMSDRAKQLAADHLLVVDLGFRAPEFPAITLGIRGIVTLTMEVTAANTDLHSGVHGGIVTNPLHATVALLSKLHDEKNRVLVPGFYDEVVTPTPAELADVDFTFDEAGYRAFFAAEPVGGEDPYGPMEASWIRPRLEINGIGGGYFGDGFKTVIPGKVVVKISCRLVPDQDPEVVGNRVRSFLLENQLRGVAVSVSEPHGGGMAVRAPLNGRAVQAARDAYAEIHDGPCSFILSGGSIPIVTDLARASRAEVVMLGFGLPGDQIHAPNEHYGLDRIEKGAASLVRILEKLAP